MTMDTCGDADPKPGSLLSRDDLPNENPPLTNSDQDPGLPTDCLRDGKQGAHSDDEQDDDVITGRRRRLSQNAAGDFSEKTDMSSPSCVPAHSENQSQVEIVIPCDQKSPNSQVEKNAPNQDGAGTSVKPSKKYKKTKKKITPKSSKKPSKQDRGKKSGPSFQDMMAKEAAREDDDASEDDSDFIVNSEDSGSFRQDSGDEETGKKSGESSDGQAGSGEESRPVSQTKNVFSDSDVEKVVSSSKMDVEEDEELFGGPDELQEAKKTVQKLTKRLEWIEERITSSFVEFFQTPFIPGATCFDLGPSPDGQLRKWLSRNEYGWAVLAIENEAASIFFEPGDEEEQEENERKTEAKFSRVEVELKRKDWCNLLASGVVEVESFQLTSGKRTLAIENTNGFQLAAVGPVGVALGRPGVLANEWLISLFEFRRFNASKAAWSRALPPRESLALLSSGSNHVAAISDAPHCILRVFTLAGVQLLVARCSRGSPIALVSRENYFIVIEQLAAGHPPWNLDTEDNYETKDLFELKAENKRDFRIRPPNATKYPKPYSVSVYAVNSFPGTAGDSGSFVHLVARTPMTLWESDSVEWAGFSNELMPVIVTKHGCVFGLCPLTTTAGYIPRELDQMSLHAQVETGDNSAVLAGWEEMTENVVEAGAQHGQHWDLQWVSLVDNLYELIPKSTDRAKTRFMPLVVSQDSIKVLLYQDVPRVLMPGEPASQAGTSVTVPFRFPICAEPRILESITMPVSLPKWVRLHKLDPKLSESTELLEPHNMATMPWQLWDEIRLRRMILGLSQKIWRRSLYVEEGNNSKGSRRSELNDVRKGVEVPAFKTALKALQEGDSGAASDLVRSFGFEKSVQKLIDFCKTRGQRTLLEELNDIRESRALIKEMRGHLKATVPRGIYSLTVQHAPTPCSHENENSSRTNYETPQEKTVARSTSSVDAGPKGNEWSTAAIPSQTTGAAWSAPFGQPLNKRRRYQGFL